jgi:hypothetical protein
MNWKAYIYIFIIASCQAQVADRESRWREDLNYMGTEFSSRHLDFHKLYPGDSFKAELERIDGDIPKLADTEIALRLMKLVASAKVGHTYVALPPLKLGFRPVQLSMRWFADGLAVIAAAPQYESALGTRVLRIGRMTAEQVLAAVAPYIAYENETWLRQTSPPYMTSVPILKHIGAIESGEHVVLTLAKPGGAPFTLDVARADPGAKLVNMYDALPIPKMLTHKRQASYYWYEYLSDSRTLYVQYNQCAEDPKLTFKDFSRDLLAFADSHAVERVIIDVRSNSGGDSEVIKPLRVGLYQRHSRVYILIGQKTFSSAEDNAIAMRSRLHAVLVGQSTGERPNGYGEVRSLTLPNSQLYVQYCTKFFRLVRGDPTALEPDIVTPDTLEDALAGRDRALEAALQHHR